MPALGGGCNAVFFVMPNESFGFLSGNGFVALPSAPPSAVKSEKQNKNRVPFYMPLSRQLSTGGFPQTRTDPSAHQKHTHVPLADDSSNSDDSRFDMAFSTRRRRSGTSTATAGVLLRCFPASAHERAACRARRGRRVSRNVTTSGRMNAFGKRTENFERVTFASHDRETSKHALSATNRAASDRSRGGGEGDRSRVYVSVSSVIRIRGSQTVACVSF